MTQYYCRTIFWTYMKTSEIILYINTKQVFYNTALTYQQINISVRVSMVVNSANMIQYIIHFTFKSKITVTVSLIHNSSRILNSILINPGSCNSVHDLAGSVKLVHNKPRLWFHCHFFHNVANTHILLHIL